MHADSPSWLGQLEGGGEGGGAPNVGVLCEYVGSGVA